MWRVSNSYAAFSPEAKRSALRASRAKNYAQRLRRHGHITTILSLVDNKVERAGDSALPFDRVELAARTNQLCRTRYWELRDHGYAAREVRVALVQEVLHISDTRRMRRRARYTALLNRRSAELAEWAKRRRRT